MVWTEVFGLKEMVQQLKNNFKKFAHVDPEKILYAGFSKKKSACIAKIYTVGEHWALFLKGPIYLIAVHLEAWKDLDERLKYYTIFHELLHIPIGGFDPKEKVYRKLLQHDLKEFRWLVGEYGPNQENVDKLGRQLKLKEEKKDG